MPPMRPIPFPVCPALLLAALACASTISAEPAQAIQTQLGSDALLLVEIPNIRTLDDGFRTTPLGNHMFGSTPGAGAALLVNFLKFFFQVYSGAPIPAWREQVGDAAQLALYFPELQADAPKELPVLLLLPLKKGETEFRGFLDRTVRPALVDAVPHLEMVEHTAGPARWDEIVDRRGGKAWASAVTPTSLLFGNPAGIKRFLEKPPAEAASLAQNPTFLSARKSVPPESQAWAFLNVTELINRQQVKQAHDIAALQRLTATGARSLGSVAASLEFRDGVATDRIALLRTQEPLVGFGRILAQPAPRPLAGLQFTPREFPISLCLNFGNGETLTAALTDILGKINDGQAMTQINGGLRFIEENIGISVPRDIMANLTGEWFLALDFPELEKELLAGVADPPRWKQELLFGFSVRNAEAVKATLRKFLDSQLAVGAGLVYRVHTDGDMEILQAGKGDLKGRTFSCAFTGDYALLANSPDLVRRALNARAEKRTLADDPDVRRRLQPFETGQNLILRLDLRHLSGVLLNVIEKFGTPLMAVSARELRPVSGQLEPLFAVGVTDERGLSLTVRSSEGLAVHIAAGAAVIDGIKKSPGARVVRTRRHMERIVTALEQHYLDRGSFPATLATLQPKYLKWMPGDPFAKDGVFAYHPGPAIDELGEKRHVSGWILVSPGPDGRMDIDLQEFDLARFRQTLQSGQEEDEAFLRRVTYQYRPERNPLENRILDTGDIYRLGSPPR